MIVSSNNKKLNGKNLFSLEFIREVRKLPKVKNAKIKGKTDGLINNSSPSVFEETGIIKSFASDSESVDGNILFFLYNHTSSPYYMDEESLLKDTGIDTVSLDKAIKDSKYRKGSRESYPESFFIKEVMTRVTYEKIKNHPKTIKDGNITELNNRGLRSETLVNGNILDIRNLSDEDLTFNSEEKYKILKDILSYFEDTKLKIDNGFRKIEDYASLYKSKRKILKKYSFILPDKKEEIESLLKETDETLKKLYSEPKNTRILNNLELQTLLEEEYDSEVDFFLEDFVQIDSSQDHPLIFPYIKQLNGENVSMIAGTTNREENSKYKVINKNTFDIRNVGDNAKRLFIVEGKMDELSLSQMLRDRGLYDSSNIITLSNVNTAKDYNLQKEIVNMLNNNSYLENVTLLLDNDNSGREATESLIEYIYENKSSTLNNFRKGNKVLDNDSIKVGDLNDLLLSDSKKQEEFFSTETGILGNGGKMKNLSSRSDHRNVNLVDNKVFYFKNDNEYIKYVHSLKYLKNEDWKKFEQSSFYLKHGKDIFEFDSHEIKGLIVSLRSSKYQIEQKKGETKEDFARREQSVLSTILKEKIPFKQKSKTLFIESGKSLPHNVIFGEDIYGDKIDKCFFINQPNANNPRKKIYSVDIKKNEEKRLRYNGRSKYRTDINVTLRRIVYEDIKKAHELDLEYELKPIEINKNNFEEYIKDFNSFKIWYINRTSQRLESMNWSDPEKKLRAQQEVKLELDLIKNTYDNFDENKKRELLDYFLNLDNIIKEFKDNNIFYQIRGSAPSFTSFDLMGYTNLPDFDIERKLGEIKELMPPERFMSPFKYSMADVDIEVSSKDKDKAIEILNKQGFFLFLVKKELSNGEIQYALHPCKMIDIPESIKPFITEKTTHITLSKEDFELMENEKAYDIINQNITRNENLPLNEETYSNIMDNNSILVQDVILNDLPQVTHAAKDMLLKYKHLEEETLPTKYLFGTQVLVLDKPSKDKFNNPTPYTLISVDKAEDVTNQYAKNTVDNQRTIFSSINSVTNPRNKQIIKENYPVEYNKNLELLQTPTDIYEVMSAAASNRPAFTGELLTINEVEYFFSIESRKLTSLENGSTLEEENYPIEIKQDLIDYFNNKYPQIEDENDVEGEEDIEEENNKNSNVYLPKTVKKRMVVDYIVENKKERKHFLNLNITNGSILFQEQMTSFLVTIAEKYIKENEESSNQQELFINQWKRKADICQSFVKKTASSLTKKTINEALNIFKESQALLSKIKDISFKEEANDIFNLQFFAFTNGAYLYNGAHGEMVAYNALQELLFKVNEGIIPKLEQENTIEVSKEEELKYEKRLEEKKKLNLEYEKLEELKAVEKYKNSDEELTLDNRFEGSYKYVDNKTDKKYEASYNGTLIPIEHMKHFIKNKTIKLGFKTLSMDKEGRIKNETLSYSMTDIKNDNTDSLLIKVSGLSKKETFDLNDFLLKLGGTKNDNKTAWISINKKGDIWLSKKNFKFEEYKDTIIKYFSDNKILDIEKVDDIEETFEEIFLPKKSTSKKKIGKKITAKESKNKYGQIIISLENTNQESIEKINNWLKETFGSNAQGKAWLSIHTNTNGSSITIRDKEEKWAKQKKEKILDFIKSLPAPKVEDVEAIEKEHKEIFPNEPKESDTEYLINESEDKIYINFYKVTEEEIKSINRWLKETFGLNTKKFPRYYIKKYSNNYSISTFKNNNSKEDIEKIEHYLNSLSIYNKNSKKDIQEKHNLKLEYGDNSSFIIKNINNNTFFGNLFYKFLEESSIDGVSQIEEDSYYIKGFKDKNDFYLLKAIVEKPYIVQQFNQKPLTLSLLSHRTKSISEFKYDESDKKHLRFYFKSQNNRGIEIQASDIVRYFGSNNNSKLDSYEIVAKYLVVKSTGEVEVQDETVSFSTKEPIKTNNNIQGF